MSREYAHIEVERVNDVTVARLTSKSFDSTNMDEIAQELFGLIDQEECSKIVLNLEKVEYLYSETLGQLVAFNNKAKIGNVQLRMCSLQPAVRELFQITKFDTLVEVRDNEARALEDF